MQLYPPFSFYDWRGLRVHQSEDTAGYSNHQVSVILQVRAVGSGFGSVVCILTYETLCLLFPVVLGMRNILGDLLIRVLMVWMLADLFILRWVGSCSGTTWHVCVCWPRNKSKKGDVSWAYVEVGFTFWRCNNSFKMFTVALLIHTHTHIYLKIMCL